MDLTPKRDYVILTTRMRDRTVWRRTLESRFLEEDLDVARSIAGHVVEMAKDGGRSDDTSEVFELCAPGAVEAAYRAGREDAAREETGRIIAAQVAALRGSADGIRAAAEGPATMITVGVAARILDEIAGQFEQEAINLGRSSGSAGDSPETSNERGRCTCDRVDVSTMLEGPGTTYVLGKPDPACPDHGEVGDNPEEQRP